MPDKETRISAEVLEKIAKENFQEFVTEEWFGVEVTIRRALPMRDMMDFVSDVVDLCFMEDGTFVPEVLDFAARSNILTHYANFTLPDNIEEQYCLVYATDAVDVVCSHIDRKQLGEIMSAVNRKIDHMCDMNIADTKAKLAEVSSAFERMSEQFSNLFGGVSADDVQKVVDAIGENGLDEEKIVASYLKSMKQDTAEAND